MARRYDDPVHVKPAADEVPPVPAQFLWRGRLYVVREVLAHWVETGAWWRCAAASTSGIDDQPGATSPAPGTSDVDGRGSAVLAEERELWRVEASAGRVLGTGVFDLSLDRRAGSWTLAQALD